MMGDFGGREGSTALKEGLSFVTYTRVFSSIVFPFNHHLRTPPFSKSEALAVQRQAFRVINNQETLYIHGSHQG